MFERTNTRSFFGGALYKTPAVTGSNMAYDLAPAPPPLRYDAEKPREKDKNTNDDAFNTEDYTQIVEHEFEKATDKPLSTFSIDVDVASYGILRRKLNENQLPPKEAVRIEEMLNYFTYNYPEPVDGKPFSVNTEIGECPWNSNHRLVQIGIQGKRMEKKNLPSANLVFLIDVSGSMMQEDKLPLVKQSLRMLVNEMNAQDKIAMVVYAGNAGLVLPSTSCNQKEKIIEAIDKLEAGGSTNGAEGINLAYKLAKQNFIESGNNRVILCTDGDFNVGVSSDAALTSLIESKRDEGIFLSVLGFGMGNYKDSKMEKLADKGNGNYAYIDNLNEAKKNLVTQMGGTLLTIAKDVKIQTEFNPAKVKAYRLIGYENRALADKDFNDDKKDAGEIGAGISVTALYEIITDANDPSLKEIPKTDPLKYQKPSEKTSAQSSDELLNVKIRYKEPKENFSKLLEFPLKEQAKKLEETSDNFRFAASVASFGLLLRDSKFKGNYTYDKVVQLATGAKGKDAEGYRSEFIRLVNIANLMHSTGQR
jgi:Ca-activated chloride channel family protein